MMTTTCTCKPDDGSGRCPREQECYENWVISHQPARLESGPQSEAQFEEDMREMYPGWGEAE